VPAPCRRNFAADGEFPHRPVHRHPRCGKTIDEFGLGWDIAGVIWGSVMSFVMPSYISGVIGGLVAVPAWEILKRYKPKSEK